MPSYDVYDVFGSDPDTFVYDIQGYVPYKIVGSTNADFNFTTIYPSFLQVIKVDNDLTTMIDDKNSNSVEYNSTWQLVISALVLCLIGLAGNVPVLVSLLRRKKSLTTHWYIFQITIANFLLTLSLTFFLFEKIFRRKIQTSASICIARSSTLFISFFASALFLILLSIDRFLSNSETSASLTKRFRSRVFTYLVTGLVWLVSIVLCIPIAVHTVSSILAKAFLTYFSVIYVAAAIVACLLSWGAWKLTFIQKSHTPPKKLTTLSETENQSSSVTWVQEEGTRRSRRRLTMISALMTSFFFVSWLLCFAFHLKQNFQGINSIFLSCEDNSPVTILQIVAEFLVYVYAVFSPYIYLAYLVRRVWRSSRG